MTSNQLTLQIAYVEIATPDTVEAVQKTPSLVKTVTIQNVSDPAVEVTIGTRDTMQATEGIILNAPPAIGKAGGSVVFTAPEDVDDAFIDLSQLFFVGSSGAAISIAALAWVPKYPTKGSSGNVQHNFYRAE